MTKVLPWLVVLLVIAAALLARRGDTKRIGVLTDSIAGYAAGNRPHELAIAQLDAAKRLAAARGDSLRSRTIVPREAARHRDSVATAEASAAAVSETAADSAGHWHAAYLARTEERDSLESVIARLDDAALEDSLALLAADSLFGLERGRRLTADSLLIESRGVIEELRRSWADRVIVGAGVDYAGRPTIVIGVELASLGDLARRLPSWMR